MLELRVLTDNEEAAAQVAAVQGPGTILIEKMQLWMTRNQNILDLGVEGSQGVNAVIDDRIIVLTRAQDINRARLFRDNGLI